MAKTVADGMWEMLASADSAGYFPGLAEHAAAMRGRFPSIRRLCSDQGIVFG